ncbi:MAG: hypothetical protein Q7O66_13170 [Dehalococcoidia bacterium]|nr:hypothetical protein [Dehalococcoidia bacterium]
MGAIGFLAIAAFAGLIISWAVLPASRHTDKVATEYGVVTVPLVQESK